MLMNRKVKIWILLLFLIVTIFLTLSRHSKSGIQNYHCEIWADKAGYYVYLPSLFVYGFRADEMPPNIDKKTGNGFKIVDGKIKTKYTYGVALMQSPFFLVGHYLSRYFGSNCDGFSILYHKIIDISAVSYSFFSLIIFYLVLIRYFCAVTSILTLICIYLGTNLFYYSIFETGMSHIYSFFLFICFVYLGAFVANGRKVHFFTLGLIIGLIIAVRPINIMFLPVFFILNRLKFIDIKKNLTNFALMAVTVVVVIVPQLIYWKYSHGSYFHYSYEGESFSNAFEPKLMQLLFSTNNGLFVYSPIAIFILVGFFLYFKKIPRESVFMSIYFLFVSYIFSSWHDWSYGCSYGCRPYVEYYSILAIPFGFFVDKLNTKFLFKPLLILSLLVFVFYNQKLMFSYDGCWYGGTWDWAELLKLLLGPTK